MSVGWLASVLRNSPATTFDDNTTLACLNAVDDFHGSAMAAFRVWCAWLNQAQI